MLIAHVVKHINIKSISICDHTEASHPFPIPIFFQSSKTDHKFFQFFFSICIFIGSIVTRRFFYMKTVKIKVIQNFMEITFYIKTYSKRTCWKKFFKFKFWLFLLTFEDEFGFRQWRPGNNYQWIKTKTLCQKLKLKIKCWITFFSKFFQRNS